jgi:histidinol-phosphate/aromatic aminotransferase/cobyric acid decarboxylase-like protein
MGSRAVWLVSRRSGWSMDSQYPYAVARQRYIRDTRRFFDALGELVRAKTHRSAANFALLELEDSATDLATRLLVLHGVYVRDRADKWGLDGDPSRSENDRILAALTEEFGAR